VNAARQKLGAFQRVSERKKTMIVAAAAVVLALANVVPLHHSMRQSCPGGGSYAASGTSMGLPLAYTEDWHSDTSDCADSMSAPLTRSFSAQALLTDALVFGVAMIGLNILLDRRTK
jgi:hypothetical protein